MSFPLVGNLSEKPERFRPLQNDGGQASRDDKKEDFAPRILRSLAPGTLSLCMIVKNEEKNIRRSLESIKPVVDEMIVVDTGSTDRTKDIAKELGAKVYDFQWKDSFSDARNFALSKATSDWILILDADEVISPLDHEALKQLIAKGPRIQGSKGSRKNSEETLSDPRILESLNASPVAYLFITRNYVQPTNIAGWVGNDGKYRAEEAGTGWFPGEKVRLFPNDGRITFRNPVHERVEPALESLGISIKQCAIPIHHYGMLDEGKTQSKSENYYELGKKRLAEMGGKDFRAVYDLAVQASGIGRYGEALEYFQKAIALKPDFAKAHESLGNTYYNLKQYEQAILWYQKSLELNPSSRDAMVMSAQCEIITGKSDVAIRQLEALLKNDPAYGKASFLAAAAYFTIGEQEKGMEYVKKLRDLHSGMISHFRDFASLLSSQQRNLEAQRLLEAAEELKNR